MAFCPLGGAVCRCGTHFAPTERERRSEVEHGPAMERGSEVEYGSAVKCEPAVKCGPAVECEPAVECGPAVIYGSAVKCEPTARVSVLWAQIPQQLLLRCKSDARSLLRGI